MNAVFPKFQAVASLPDADTFRSAMRNLAGGVNVVTSGRDAEITGFTATSVSSFSVDPPSMLVSVNRSSSSFPALQGHGFFGVNLLHDGQVAIAERFAGKNGEKGRDRFLGADWAVGMSGVPLLVGALAAIECQIEDLILRHSHAILIGRVLDVRLTERQAALCYWRGNYISTNAVTEPNLGDPQAGLRPF